MMSKEQSDDVNADIKLLLECLEYQKSNPAALKQAIVTLSSAVCGSGSQNAQDIFRNAGGIPKVLKIVRTSKSDEVTEVGLFCIGNAVEKNVYSQKLLSNASFFNFLHGILSPSGSTGGKKRQMAAFVLLCLVSNNSFGQNMARQSSCLHDIISLIRTTLSTSIDRQRNRSLETWATLVRAACVCVNNPVNDENQRICSTLFPYLLNVVGTHTDEGILKPALSLICLTVSYNAQNQGKLARYGGLPILIKKLKSSVIEMQEDTAYQQVAIQVICTLDVCITENEVNSKTFGEMGGIILVLNMLLNPGLKSQDKIQLVLTLAHAVEAYDTNKDSISVGNGIKTLIQLMTESANEELTKTTKYLLHLCVSSDEKDAVIDEEIPQLDGFASKLEEMKRNSDMEILKKLNDLDTKLKDIENRETDSNRNFVQSAICEQKPETVWSDMYEKPMQHCVNKAMSVCSTSSVSCQHEFPTPREKTLMDELIKEKIEREKVEKLNQLLQEDIEMRKATEKEHQSNEIKLSGKLASKNTPYLLQNDEVVPQFKQTECRPKLNKSQEDWSMGTMLHNDWSVKQSGSKSYSSFDKTEVPICVNRNERYIAPCKPNSNTLYAYPVHGTTIFHEDGAILNVDDNHFDTINMKNNNRNINVVDNFVADISKHTLHQVSEGKAINVDQGNENHSIRDNTKKFVECSQQTWLHPPSSSTMDSSNTVSNQERINQGPKRSIADIAEGLDCNNNSRGKSKNAQIQCGTPYVNNGGKKDATSMTEVDGSSQTYFIKRSNDYKRKLINTSTEASPTSVKESVINNEITNRHVRNKVAKVVLSDIMSPSIMTKCRRENTSISQPKQLLSRDMRENESNKHSSMFVKPTAAPPKKKVRVTRLLGSKTQLNNFKNSDRKNLTVYAESSCSGIESEFDCQLLKAIKNVNKKTGNRLNANHSLKYGRGGGGNKIKSQNNTRKLDKYLNDTRHDATYTWRMDPATQQSQQVIPVRPAFSDCGTRRLNVYDSPYSVKSVGCLGKNNLHDNGMDMQEEIRQPSPGNSSVDSNIEDCRSSSDVSENDVKSLNITAAALRSHRKQHRVSYMCPGCDVTSDDKGNYPTSRNYNIVLETHPNTCMYHRQLRAYERHYIKARKKRLRTERKKSGRLLDFKRLACDKMTSKACDYVISDSDSDHVSPPDQDEDWDGKIHRKQRTKERRHRVPYTQKEEDNLIEGVRKMGKHWNQILVTYSFHPSRTNVDLMDKYKRMVAADSRLSEMHSTKPSRASKPFSLCEERRLRKGVNLYGYNWKAILQAYGFDKDRTSEELRSKWRVLQKKLGLE